MSNTPSTPTLFRLARNAAMLFTFAFNAPLTYGAEVINALGISSGLNLLSFGNFVVPSADVQGRVAVGGNANITTGGYSVNTLNGTSPLYSGAGLTVGGNLIFKGGVVGGNSFIGGNLSTGAGASFLGDVQVGQDLNANGDWLSANSIYYGGSATNLADYQDPVPVRSAVGLDLGFDFLAERARLSNLSKALDGLTNVGIASITGPANLQFNAKGSKLAVFDLVSTDMTRNMEIINLAAGGTVLFNVHDKTVDFTSHNYQNFMNGQVLFNLVDAEFVNFEGAVNASFLAPGASFQSKGGVINGQVVVSHWYGNAQVNDAAFNGEFMTVPEPGTSWLLFVAALSVALSRSRFQKRAGTQTRL